jgi:enoyl-CoA hydratase/carnithine racemase
VSYNTLLVEQKDTVVFIRINRPQMANKLSIECMQEINQLLKDKAVDKTCRSVILAGQEDYFCSGGELGDFRKKDSMEVKAFGNAFITLHTGMANFPKPVIAAVEGNAFGGGFSLVEACDLGVGADSALFAIPETADGLAPAMGLSGIYANLGKKRVMALGLMSQKLTAQEALSWGMLNFVVPKKDVLKKAYEVGDYFANISPTAVRLFKELYVDMGFLDYERRLRLGQSLMLTMFKSNDGMEFLNSRDENRCPKWQ